MRRTFYQPGYFALISTALLIWAGVATYLGRGGYGIAAAVALGIGLASATPTFALWRNSKLQGGALAASSVALSLVSFPLTWLALYYAVRLGYAGFATSAFPNNWNLNVDAWNIIYQLPADDIFLSIYALTLAYVTASATAALENKGMRRSGLALATGFGAYGTWFLVAAVALITT